MKAHEFYTALDEWLPRRVRLWLYAVAVAVLAALGAFHVLDGDAVDALVNILAALLFGIAIRNVPTGGEK